MGSTAQAESPLIRHASCVALAGKGVLIVGPAGAGKSALALDLMSRGAALVADDRVALWRQGDQVLADAPPMLRGRIEARQIGLLRADAAGPVPLALVVDLSRPEPQRLPPLRHTTVLGVPLALVFARHDPHLAPAIRQLMIGGRDDPEAAIRRAGDGRAKSIPRK
ncbi:HPr kinase/phosphorylase [Paracoccus jiaweipingae]|uniref:HPr kinase/phosphorylase n=1 Tax=unclassified Paracoccus (in: a-proteobacteria) TaxID=2688777 RepID=UPI00378F4004